MNLTDYNKYMTEQPRCNCCGLLMSLVNTPSLNVGDGLGWGSDVIWVCLNNKCESFLKSWDSIYKQIGCVGAYRLAKLPNEKKQFCLAVFSNEAYTDVVMIDKKSRKDILKTWQRLLK